MTSSPRRPRNERPRLSDAIVAAGQSGPGAGCPSIEDIHGAVAGTLADSDRKRILAHAGACGACAAEVTLAEAFERPVTAAEAREVDAVLASIRRPIPTLRSAPQRSRRILAAVLSAAAVVLLGVTIGPRLFDGRPEIGRPSDVPRGNAIQLESPLAGTPAGTVTFRWTSVSGAQSYDVTVKAADGSEVLRRRSTENRLEVASQAGDGVFQAGSVYFWNVRAVGSEGADLGSSGTGTFTIVSTIDASQPR